MHRSGELKCHGRRIHTQLVAIVIASLRRVNDDVTGHSVPTVNLALNESGSTQNGSTSLKDVATGSFMWLSNSFRLKLR